MPPTITLSNFIENQFGINYNSVESFIIKNNRFTIGKLQDVPLTNNFSFLTHGAKLSASSNFIYCENRHEGIANPYPGFGGIGTPYRTGTIAENTGGNDEEIEMNTYALLEIGNYAKGACGTVPGGNKGLNYLENINVSNKNYDFNIYGMFKVQSVAPHFRWHYASISREYVCKTSGVVDWRHWPGSEGTG
ncbi:MAG: hypothetical protein IPN26_16210 [Bacteroidetes bacterium]|nr:hypothetical protein [Bacteroidota bacterium]